MPQPIVMLAELNPLSNGADLIRSFLLGNPTFTLNMTRNIVVFSIVIATSATVAYMKIIERR